MIIKKIILKWFLVITISAVLPVAVNCGDGGGDDDGDAAQDTQDADIPDDTSVDPTEDIPVEDISVDDMAEEDIVDIREEIPVTEVDFNHVVIDEGGPQDIWLKSVGDLNGDTLIDLIAGGRSSGGLVWYENPYWTRHTIASGGSHSTDGETADVDRDDDLDLVALTTSEIRWYENPDWTVHVIETRELHDVELSDFDGDGDVDVVARNQGEFGGSGATLHFYRQDSPTSWTHWALSCADGEGLCVADIDRDGDDDIVINGSWFENSGEIVDGAWNEHVFTTSWTHRNVFADTCDFNGDGRVDIALSPSELAGGTYRVSWFEAPVDPAGGEWTEHIIEDDVETVHHFVGGADMNNDGVCDVATAEMHQGVDPDEVKIFLNEGAGLSWLRQVLAESGSHSMRIVDYDNDGDNDLYGANWQGNVVELWENLTLSP